MYTVIDSVPFRPLPFRDADRLVSIRKMVGQFENSVPRLEYQDIRTRSHSLQDVIGIGVNPAVIETPYGGEKVSRVTITANFLDMLAVHPALGRRFNDNE